MFFILKNNIVFVKLITIIVVKYNNMQMATDDKTATRFRMHFNI